MSARGDRRSSVARPTIVTPRDPIAAAGLLAVVAVLALAAMLIGPPPACAAPTIRPSRPGSAAPAAHAAPATHAGPAAAATPPASGTPPASTTQPPPAGPSAPAGAASPPSPPGGLSDPNAQSTSLAGHGPLVSNGFGSPSCRSGSAPAGLPAAARANCRASGLITAPAPVDNYQFDIHIDTGIGEGIGGSIKGGMAAVVQDYLLTPLWMALVWATDVLMVAIEWCYSIDLLGTGALGPIARGLETMHRSLTTPWLATVLAIAAVTFLYRGLIRRRVVETLGQFALMLAMMIGGLWVIVEPAGTVGAVSGLANQASLGVLAASATGDPAQPTRGLAGSLDQVFETAVGTPWCYLEFGNVAWCDDPGRLDPELRRTAIAIAALDSRSGSPAGTRQARGEEAGIAAARTNGALFLALPANGPGRNSINASAFHPSLLRALCGSDVATACTASTGPEAEFRTEKGTFARIGGLLLIALGELGMFGFLGFLALRLLSAALLSVLYLLLAPLAVLAPALGDGGRALFRLWSLRLLGSVLAKLVYSVFLGVVLLMLRVLGELGNLGWWTQWLLIASFWWIVFNHRHQLLEHVIHERGESTRRASLGSRLFAAHQAARLARPVTQRIVRAGKSAFEAGRGVPGPAIERIGGRNRRGSDEAPQLAQQVTRTLERDHAHAVSTVAAAPAREAELTALRERRDLLRKKGREAEGSGDRRRVVRLRLRQEEVDARIKAGEHELATAQTMVRRGEENTRQTGVVHDAGQRERQAELFDREAERRPLLASPRDKRTGRRDYPELATLAGVSRSGYSRLGGTQRRRAQLEIDRALERRREWSRKTELNDREKRISGWHQKTRRRESPAPRPTPRPVGARRRQFDTATDEPEVLPTSRRPRAPRADSRRVS